jgi:hypothetical protein
MTLEPDLMEAELAAGRLCCPGCDGRLAPWGLAREREVRTLDGSRRVRPRRASCVSCAATHVILPASLVPRRRGRRRGDWPRPAREDPRPRAPHDRRAPRSAAGDSPRLAARRWTPGRRAAVCATRWIQTIQPTAETLALAASPLAGALDALRAAVRACRLELGMRVSPWELAVALTGGLQHGRPRDPPA